MQRLERGGERRAVHGKQRRNRCHAGRLGPVQRHHQRELPAGQAERPQCLVEAARERPRRALQVKAQAGVANEEAMPFDGKRMIYGGFKTLIKV